MESSIVDASVVSKKRRRDEEEEEELEQVFFIIVSVATMLLGAMAWYHDKYFVKEPAQNLELERQSFLNRLYKGTETDCIDNMENKKKMEIQEAQEMVHEVVNELDNIANFNGALRHKAIDWLTENPIKFAIIKALPLDEKKDYILSFMP